MTEETKPRRSYETGYQDGYAKAVEETAERVRAAETASYAAGYADGLAAGAPTPTLFDQCKTWALTNCELPDREIVAGLRAIEHERDEYLSRADRDLVVAQARRRRGQIGRRPAPAEPFTPVTGKRGPLPEERAETEYTTVAA